MQQMPSTVTIIPEFKSLAINHRTLPFQKALIGWKKAGSSK